MGCLFHFDLERVYKINVLVFQLYINNKTLMTEDYIHSW